MNYSVLIKRVDEKWPNIPLLDAGIGFNAFSTGAHWMFQRMQDLNLVKANQAPNLPWNTIGYFKYALVSLTALGLSGACSLIEPLLMLSFPIWFYLLELPLVFLFPILIQQNSFSIKHSVQLIQKTGFTTSFLILIQLAAGMLFPSRNFYNWHKGCLAVLIWYEEVTAR